MKKTNTIALMLLSVCLLGCGFMSVDSAKKDTLSVLEKQEAEAGSKFLKSSEQLIDPRTVYLDMLEAEFQYRFIHDKINLYSPTKKTHDRHVRLKMLSYARHSFMDVSLEIEEDSNKPYIPDRRKILDARYDYLKAQISDMEKM